MNRTGLDPLAVATEHRLAAMVKVPRENALTKARRYLIEGRVQLRVVTNRQVRGQVRGGGHLWNTRYDSGRWECDCPARSSDCCHLLAVKAVVVVDEGGTA